MSRQLIFSWPHFKFPTTSPDKKWWLTVASIALTLIGVLWFVSTVIPVLWVEVKYQTRNFLEETFHVSSVRSLIIPTITFNDLGGRSKYQEYGIVIPDIYLDEPVIFNVDPNDERAYTEALKKGIAHASSTAFPDSGGIGYYFAHSSNPSFRQQLNAVFYLLGKLQPGNKVFIWHEGKQSEYVVTHTKVTPPEDVSFLDETQYQKETVVLQTCWPPGTTNQRLLVFAERKPAE